MIISRTPLRLSLVGGGSDYFSFFSRHGGLVIGGAINQYVHITARYLPPLHDFHSRVVYLKDERVKGNGEIEHPAVRAVIQDVGLEEAGLEIFHQSDLPGRSGTGSSSSFMVGLLNALHTLQGRSLSPSALAGNAIHLEREVLGESGGCQDQLFAAFGGLNQIRFYRDGEMLVLPLPLSPCQIADLESHLALYYLRMPRTSSTIAKASGQQEGKDHNFAIYRLAEQGMDAILACDWRKLGDLIDKSWRVKASLPGVTNEVISDIYVRARLSGAMGGKLIGAGGGGCLLLVVPPEKRAAVDEAVGLPSIPVKFSNSGSSIVYHGV